MGIRVIVSAVAFLAITTAALGHDVWINTERRTNAKGEWCCNQHDCAPLDEAAVKMVKGGFLLVATGEIIPHAEAMMSGDDRYWRCKRPNNQTRCFFYPPPGT